MKTKLKNTRADTLLVQRLRLSLASRQKKPLESNSNMNRTSKDTRPPLRLAQPLNAYNIYYVLERQRLIDEIKLRMWDPDAVKEELYGLFSLYDLSGSGYDCLSLPDFPPRFINLQMPLGWYVPGRNSKRKHVRSHGCE